jgi:hypothetical protein
MALLTLDQILVPLRYSGSVLTVTGSDFVVSGSSTFLQQTTSSFAVISSGSVFITNGKSPITGSLEGNPVDGGSF